MKQMFLTILFVLFVFSFVKAQTSETISELTPVPPNIGKFSKYPPQYKSPYVGNYKIKFDANAEVINLSDGKKGVAVTIQITNGELNFADIGGRQTAKIKIYGRVTSKDKTIDGFFEEELETFADIEELTTGIYKSPVTLRKMFELPAEKYQIGIIVRDRISGMNGVKVIKFQIDAAK